MKALVLFSGGSGTHWLAPLLEPGFKHCAVAVASGAYWIVIDPAFGTPTIEVVAGADFDLAAHYRAAGFTVVEADTNDTAPRLPLAYANCVGLVKFVLGLRKPQILTPYQLYRHLAKEV